MTQQSCDIAPTIEKFVMDPNPYESPKNTDSNSHSPRMRFPWVNVCIAGLLLLCGGQLFSGLLSVVTYAPEGYAFRDWSKFTASLIVNCGLLTILIGGIAWWFSTRK